MPFYVVKETKYSDELYEIFSASQIEALNGEGDCQFLKIEKQINGNLHQLMKQREISGKIYHRLRKTELQQAWLYELSKVH